MLPFVADIYVDEHDHIVNSYNIYPILLMGSLSTIYLVPFINIVLFILFSDIIINRNPSHDDEATTERPKEAQEPI
jgi:hypothetical protein